VLLILGTNERFGIQTSDYAGERLCLNVNTRKYVCVAWVGPLLFFLRMRVRDDKNEVVVPEEEWARGHCCKYSES